MITPSIIINGGLLWPLVARLHKMGCYVTIYIEIRLQNYCNPEQRKYWAFLCVFTHVALPSQR